MFFFFFLFFFGFPPFCKKDFSWITGSLCRLVSLVLIFVDGIFLKQWVPVTSGASNLCSHHPIAFSCMLKQEVVFRVYLTEVKGFFFFFFPQIIIIMRCQELFECLLYNPWTYIVWCNLLFFKIKKKVIIYRFYLVILMKCPQLLRILLILQHV